MEKKYQVFVSSTYSDLIDERKEIIQALLELECIPVGMEMFPAANNDQWTLIKRLIDDCDYYILIMGGRYGSVSKEGISYTQMEYEYAVSQNIPVIAFLHNNPDSIPTGKSEKDPDKAKQLQEFKAKVELKLCKYWENASDLGSKVSRSLIRLIKDNPRIGWVKASNIPTEDTSKEILELKKQNEELIQRLLENAETPPEGTEDLAQGNDTIELFYTYVTTSKQTSMYVTWEDEKLDSKTFKVHVTWNEIFKEISPLMIDEASESSLKDKLLTFCRNRNEANEEKGIKEMSYYNYHSSYFDDNSFNQIKVQLKALGLIKKNDRKRSMKDCETYWSLTDYGDHQMTRLIAIKK